MSQQSRPVAALSFQASGAVAFARAVQVVPAVLGRLTAAQATVSGQKIVGIANRAAASGEWFDAIVDGTACCEAGAAFSEGTRMMVDSSGRVVTAPAAGVAAGATPVTSAAANGAAALSGADLPLYCMGIALEASAGAGSFVEVLLR